MFVVISATWLRAEGEWIDTDGDGIVDTIRLPPFSAGGGGNYDPSDPTGNAGNEPTRDPNEGETGGSEGGSNGGDDDGGNTDIGGSLLTELPGAVFIPNTQKTEMYKGVKIIGTIDDVAKAKALIDDLLKDPQKKELLNFLVAEAERKNKVVNIQFGDLKNMPVGRWSQTEQSIDLTELKKLPESGPASQKSIFAHELFEQLYYQAFEGNRSFTEVHEMALNLEREISGYFRYKDDEIYTRLLGGHEVVSYYQANDNENDKQQVRYSIDGNGDVISVTKSVIP